MFYTRYCHNEATAENGPWIITLDPPIYRSVMQHARNRLLRKEVYCAYIIRASTGDLNNTHIIEQILKLRLEKAKLLGYNNYAEVQLRISSWDAAVRDMEELRQFAEFNGADEAGELNHWDFNFWGERLCESSYDINEEELRPYLSFPAVTEGLFSLSSMLFDVNIHPADGLAPVWNEDVRFYCVKDSTGDPYSRPSEKRGGAWVSLVVGRSCALSIAGTTARLPIVHVVCNQTPPLGDKPSLMTFREVETIFHEFGHALQHMLTKEDEGFVSGNRGMEWDAVELPSSFMENWCYRRAIISSIAKHYETGQNLPEDMCMKLLSTRTFRAGSVILRQMRYAAVDLELHSEYIPGGPESIYEVRQVQLLELIPSGHDYAAGYYSYQWAEVMSYDAFSAFEEAGLDNQKAIEELGRKFRDTVLALGGGKSPLEVCSFLTGAFSVQNYYTSQICLGKFSV
ncbi:hypothetical protein Cgig2_007832 [Carnegiea gigantea]|uniref:oligopeptidase A n=1 Tax=Carnegiea gigantea TaxID=171969 RepID=A0A9Q1GW63_9CARY|nr:hypothetical protein Cgig2_007832 [Carnegiea gigantea]